MLLGNLHVALMDGNSPISVSLDPLLVARVAAHMLNERSVRGAQRISSGSETATGDSKEPKKQQHSSAI